MVIKPFLLLSLAAEYRSQRWVWSTVVQRRSDVYDTYVYDTYWRTKLTVPEMISHSRDIVGAYQNLNGSRGGGQQTVFVTDFELWPNISATEHITIGKKFVKLQGLPYVPPKFGKLWSTNGWEWLASFCPPPKFLLWATLPALPYARYVTDSRQTLACVM